MYSTRRQRRNAKHESPHLGDTHMTRSIFRTARAFKHGSVYTLVTRTLRVEYHYYRADRMLVRKIWYLNLRNPSVRIEHNVSPRSAMASARGGMLLLGKPSSGGFAL